MKQVRANYQIKMALWTNFLFHHKKSIFSHRFFLWQKAAFWEIKTSEKTISFGLPKKFSANSDCTSDICWHVITNYQCIEHEKNDFPSTSELLFGHHLCKNWSIWGNRLVSSFEGCFCSQCKWYVDVVQR